MTDAEWAAIRHFKPSEFTRPGDMAFTLIQELDALREEIGVPVYVTSSYRTGDAKAHGRGLAVDIADNDRGSACTSAWRFAVLRAAFYLGFGRIGIYDRHIHLDVAGAADGFPQQVAWWGESS